MPKCLNYQIFKDTFGLENYFEFVPDYYLPYFIKFRMCNHHLPIEKGRWQNIERNLRKCQLCNLNDIGDEFHYILNCPFFANQRQQLLPYIRHNTKNAILFKRIMNETDISIFCNLVKFIKTILDYFKNTPG